MGGGGGEKRNRGKGRGKKGGRRERGREGGREEEKEKREGGKEGGKKRGKEGKREKREGERKRRKREREGEEEGSQCMHRGGGAEVAHRNATECHFLHKIYSSRPSPNLPINHVQLIRPGNSHNTEVTCTTSSPLSCSI